MAHSFSKESAGESVFVQCLLADPDLDAELESLRDKVAKVMSVLYHASLYGFLLRSS